MAIKRILLLGFILVLGSAGTTTSGATKKWDNAPANRSSFPAGFVFGTASASYQYEGAAKIGGRGPSIWDTYAHKYPEKIFDHNTGDVAVDQYHRYKEDVGILKHMGFDAYRFSFSWSRLLPNGKLSGGVNKEGIRYYNSLIDELLAKGIKPFVTIFHWDLPQALEDEYGGFLSPKIVAHYQDYAELCFKEFGDRVKHWITLNEPHSYSRNGYATGKFAPGRCSAWQKRNCTGGDSGTEPYLASHYQLLAHAAAVKLYRQKYQAKQKGLIGITLVSHWFVPYSSDSNQDKAAALRALDFMFGWYMDPMTNGDYPSSMRHLVGNRLPKFSQEESAILKGSFDFLGLNYYTGNYAANVPYRNPEQPSYSTDSLANLTAVRNGVPIGRAAASDWLHFYPQGFLEILLYTKRKYNNPLIYITENGWDDRNDPKLSLKEALADHQRIKYYDRHLYELHRAIKVGVKVKGYFAWSLLDNFEWADGYSCRFGLNFVDYKNGLKRYPKLSATWFRDLLRK